MRNLRLHTIRIFALLLMMLLSGTLNNAWATKVTYHILTLPIDNDIYHMVSDVNGKRLEAFKVTMDNQSTLELPAQYKSPLATGFKYYKATDVTSSGSAVQLFQDNTKIKGVLYQINGEDTPDNDSDDATPVAEGTTLSGSSAEYYVVYTYDASNAIAQLNGNVRYNIRTKYKDNGTWKDRGFFALNRGRNNRPAVLPTANVDPEMLASEDFMKASVTGTSVNPYWEHNTDQKNKREDIASKFHFIFQFEGVDPYNIIIRTAYAKDTTYIEKNDGTSNFVYKWYKEASLFAVSSGNNCYIASDEHKLYNITYNTSTYPTNPTDLREGVGLGYTSKLGNYHGQTGVVWSSFALLPNSDNSGYVFMGTRTVDANGAINNTLYYLKQKDNCNNLNFASGNSSDNLSIEGIYPIEKVTFKVVTPFGNTISVADQVSKYTVDNDAIETKYLPAALKRKYCTFNNKFYKDAACTQAITHFSHATKDPSEGYQVYVGYDVSPSAPKFLSPSADYTTATWYELTDEGSVQESGRKIKNNSGTYKNNGANGEFVKESEFAFEGDPYELKVLYRKGTETSGSKTYVTLSDNDSWDVPDDETAGSFLLRKFNDTGYWSWDPGQTSVAVAYGSSSTPSIDKNAHAVTINLSGLNTSKYYKITTGGAGVSQITSVSPSANTVRKVPGTTMAVVVNVAENKSGADKVMTVTIQEYNDGEGNTPFGSASTITITQDDATSEFAGNNVTYSTTSSTRVKVLTLPTRTYTYKIVDKSGRIAVKASANQTIYSKLSLASIPSIIVSPFLVGETVTFYDTYGGTGRSSLSGAITETPDVDHDIFVKYTTSALNNKPINLSEDQEFNVVLNGEYIYYDRSSGSVKSKKTPNDSEKASRDYFWKLRNRDPYHMLIDNMGAREVLPDVAHKVAGEPESVTVYEDDGSSSSKTRQMGAWVKLGAALGNDVALTFDTNRGNAQQFIAKAGLQDGVYEVMVAAGDDGTDNTDASKHYYNIGRTSSTDIKIYDNEHYVHGNSVLMFQLEQAVDYIYHLIDKYDHVLLSQKSQSPDLALPAEYQSPLVETYHYYDPRYIDIDDDTYTLTEDPTPVELTKLSDLEATATSPTSSTSGAYDAADSDHKHTDATTVEDISVKAKKLKFTGNHYYKIGDDYYMVNVTKIFYQDIYVTYDINDRVKFNDKASPYMLKFLQPHAGGYYLEDGNDKLTPSPIEAVYPYCNGDGSLNIYGEEMQKEQFNGGAATRPRWIWFFESEKKDPYHVMIHSSNTISFNSVSHPTYLQTFAVDFLQGTKHIVTCGMLPTIASEEITEYMVLGTDGQFKLRTTKTINDGTGDLRRDVTSLEQYWKTYNMAKLHVLNVNKNTDAYSTDESTWVVPTVDDPSTGVDESNYRATLAARDWHSYAIYANATRWNGYNDKEEGHEKKCVEKLEHWFQTFDMGDGSFDIESASIPPVLVLLDLHGWEIMRQPLPDIKTYPEGEELKALRVYDSPMVDKYYFYSNATKASGCHKYSLRMQDGKERDQIKVDGVRYSSSSLGDLPPITATGVKSNGVLNDQYVIYTVKEEYAKSYDYTFTDNGNNTYSESGTASKYLVLLASRFLRDNGASTSYFSKPIYEASEPTGGNVYEAILDPQTVTVSNKSTAVDVSPKDGYIDDINLWYVQPNLNIDKEMGIKYAAVAGNTGEPWTEFETKKYYYENGKSGFDPYNIQLKNAVNGKFVTSHITTTALEEGVLKGDYSGSGGTTDLTLADEYDYSGWNPNTDTESEGYDHTNLTISNQTFMAVSDANGNLQLMPRFDHKKRVNLVNDAANSLTTLQDPVDHAKASADDNSSMGTQTAFFVRSQIFEYQIINNNGTESLRYKRGGDYYPTITDHFKSPLATDFKYYKGAEYSVENSSSSDYLAADASFRRTATSEGDMKAQAGLFTTKNDVYYFNINNGASYKKVTVNTVFPGKEITGSFADAELDDDDCHVYVRYSYDANADHEGDRILEGKWFTVKLDNKDVVASGKIDSVVPADGTGVSLFQADSSKPSPVDEDDKTWQWKFLAAPMDPESEYYVAPDPYDIQIFNRNANYTTDLSLDPNPMGVGIKVNGKDRFSLLSHPDGGYALAVNGLGTYSYDFLNGADMTTSVAATTATETSYTQKTGVFDGIKSQLLVSDDVEYNFTYKVINNGVGDYAIDNPGYLAVEATQDNATALSNGYVPYLPVAAQTPLLNVKTDEEKEGDYLYYGSVTKDDKGTGATSDDTYKVVTDTKLFTLYGLYDDVVYVRYKEYDMDNTEFKVPNEKDIVDSHVARGEGSIDVSMNINGGLPYNIIWYSDNMMQSTDDSAVSDGGSKGLSGNKQYVWYFIGNDPYGLKIQHKGGKYLNGTAALVEEASAPTFMLLTKSGYDCGILQETGGNRKFTFGDHDSDPGTPDTFYMDAGDPTKFIIFGLSIHNLKYHLIIAKSCPDKDNPKAGEYVDIDYRATESETLTSKRIYGTTQRDLTSVNDGGGTHYVGEKYQLGETLSWGNPVGYHTYSHDAGSVSIGDDLVVPNDFSRPNCSYEFYIEGIYQHYSTANENEGKPHTTLNNKYKGLKCDKLMSDEDLIDQDVVVNVVYKFDSGLETNAGDDFVTKMELAGTHYLWYTFETTDATPQLAHYTHVRGMRAESGHALHYTNDYLWSPLGDVYGFRMYNRYIYKNNGASKSVLTTASIADGQEVVMGSYESNANRDIYELLPSGDIGTGSFRVHPLLDDSNTLFLSIVETEGVNKGKLILSNATPVKEWTYGLSTELLNPHYQGAGNVGGLTTTIKAGTEKTKSGKELYEDAQTEFVDKPARLIRELQKICYDKDNIVDYAPGYYRLCNQPGASSLSPQRYASGYLHDIERDLDKNGSESDAIPMHFYSKVGVNGTFDGDTNPLKSGFTKTAATQGDIPVPATAYDPSTIFYFSGDAVESPSIPTSTMQTQGLYVMGDETDAPNNGYAKMTSDSEDATSFHVDDIGGAVVIIYNLDGSSKRHYINYKQGDAAHIYDLHYYENVDVDASKWCMEPADTMMVTMNNGGDGYYYSTFYAPFDVLLPADVEANPVKETPAKNYYAYTCDKWDNNNLHPKKVPAVTGTPSYAAGKFVPAGTPVIFRIKDESGSMKLTLPSNAPTVPDPAISCAFSGEYLEQMLGSGSDVYTLGLPFKTEVSKDVDYNTTGDIVAPGAEQANSGLGFYINATANKENNERKARWDKNNRYVIHNKIYYRADASARELDMETPEFVPIIFDFEEGEEESEELQPDGNRVPVGGDNKVYDLSGRCVANEQQVQDGSWWHQVTPGIYILNGRKIIKK